MNFKMENLKSLFLRIMLGCLVAAAAVAVVTILTGNLSDLADKALWTIALIGVHALLSFGFIVNNERQETFDSLEFFTNVTFGLIILSFITSVLGVWTILSGDLVGKLYEFYFVLLFATLHAEILSKMRNNQQTIDRIVWSNFLFMAIVVLMLVPVIFIDNSITTLGSFFFRVLGAAGVIDATLTLSAVILYKLYLRKHPKTSDSVFNLPPGAPGAVITPGASGAAAVAVQAKPQGHMNLFVKILIAYVALQLLSGLALFVFFLFAIGNN